MSIHLPWKSDHFRGLPSVSINSQGPPIEAFPIVRHFSLAIAGIAQQHTVSKHIWYIFDSVTYRHPSPSVYTKDHQSGQHWSLHKRRDCAKWIYWSPFSWTASVVEAVALNVPIAAHAIAESLSVDAAAQMAWMLTPMIDTGSCILPLCTAVALILLLLKLERIDSENNEYWCSTVLSMQVHEIHWESSTISWQLQRKSSAVFRFVLMKSSWMWKWQICAVWWFFVQ